MPIQSKAGTAQPRRFDPVIPRVLPRGLQNTTGYSAALCFFDPDIVTGGIYSFQIRGNSSRNAIDYNFLLFGTDYVASSQVTYYYQNVFSAGATPVLPYSLSQTYNLNDGIVGGLVNYSPLFSDPVGTIGSGVDEILTGKTKTNNVSASGFSLLTSHFQTELYTDEGDEFVPFIASMNVSLNCASTKTDTAAIDVKSFDPPQLKFYIPIILWEPNFTQQIVDNNYIIETNGFRGYYGAATVPTAFLVVGIFDSGEPPYPVVSPLRAPRGGAPVAPSTPLPRFPVSGKPRE
jgi:hypothetical protein